MCTGSTGCDLDVVDVYKALTLDSTLLATINNIIELCQTRD